MGNEVIAYTVRLVFLKSIHAIRLYSPAIQDSHPPAVKPGIRGS